MHFLTHFAKTLLLRNAVDAALFQAIYSLLEKLQNFPVENRNFSTFSFAESVRT